MSIIYKCDRCGKIEEKWEVKNETWQEIMVLGNVINLCDKCKQEFEEFMEGK